MCNLDVRFSRPTIADVDSLEIRKGLGFYPNPCISALFIRPLLRRARLPIPPRPQRVFENKGVLKPLSHHTLIALICDNIFINLLGLNS